MLPITPVPSAHLPGNASRLRAAGTSTLLSQLLLATGATNVVECGSADGDLTVRIARALSANGRGRVIGCEADRHRAGRARGALERVGLTAYGRVVPGVPGDLLAAVEGPVDLLVLGGEPGRFLPALRLFEPRLLPGAVIVTRTGAAGAEDAADLLVRLRAADSGYVSLPLTLDGGLELSVRVD
ncbi:O-methyltransferase [Streptomyces sp. NPDC094038]|uniref:O-methyltransferase n=1 Tax=Streptomyces sp. NPDC094038 TaxID=3366055 RepID=UPI00380A5D79